MCKLLLPVYDVSASKSKNKSYFHLRRKPKYRWRHTFTPAGSKSITSVTFTPDSVKSEALAPLHRHEKRLKSCMCYKNRYYISVLWIPSFVASTKGHLRATTCYDCIRNKRFIAVTFVTRSNISRWPFVLATNERIHTTDCWITN